VNVETLANGAPNDPKHIFKGKAARFCEMEKGFTPWCELGSSISDPKQGPISGTLACPHGWKCPVPGKVGSVNDKNGKFIPGVIDADPNTDMGAGAPNDAGRYSVIGDDSATAFDGPDCGKGGADDATCPRFCTR
jgi:hypothetical protein